jgi:hypothetical protein
MTRPLLILRNFENRTQFLKNAENDLQNNLWCQSETDRQDEIAVFRFIEQCCRDQRCTSTSIVKCSIAYFTDATACSLHISSQQFDGILQTMYNLIAPRSGIVTYYYDIVLVISFTQSRLPCSSLQL